MSLSKYCCVCHFVNLRRWLKWGGFFQSTAGTFRDGTNEAPFKCFLEAADVLFVLQNLLSHLQCLTQWKTQIIYTKNNKESESNTWPRSIHHQRLLWGGGSEKRHNSFSGDEVMLTTPNVYPSKHTSTNPRKLSEFTGNTPNERILLVPATFRREEGKINPTNNNDVSDSMSNLPAVFFIVRLI